MVNLGLQREVPLLLHFDGEFASPEDLVIDALTGRSFGWLPTEVSVAVAHIARVIRLDDGMNPRHINYSRGGGIPYRVAMLSSDSSVPPELRLPAGYRLNVVSASDEEVLQAVGRLIHAYINSLRFGTENTLRRSGSPYDRFLAKNHLPAIPERGETGLEYAQKLPTLIGRRARLVWVTEPDDGSFQLHRQAYKFGPEELEGLKIFFTRTSAVQTLHAGGCVACHTPPQFTDYRPHNNGASQAEYDALHGHGAFAALEVPSLVARNAAFNAYLPQSPKHPSASGRFRAVPTAGKPGFADLGVWNVFANPDMPKPQAALAQILCGHLGLMPGDCSPEAVLPLTIAFFKTASVRDLGQSEPYFHSGAVDTIEDVLRFYISTSVLARSGNLRNGSPEISDIRIDATDIAPLSAFLRSLNEDYH